MRPQAGELFSIGDFSRLSGIKRRNLIFYDECDLLAPDTVGANGFRYYRPRQLAAAHAILAFRRIGFGLKDIKEMLASPRPGDILGRLAGRERVIGLEMAKLEESLKLLRDCRAMLDPAMRAADGNRVLLEQRPRENVLFGPEIVHDGTPRLHDAFAEFRRFARERGAGVGVPFCVEMARDSLLRGEWGKPRRMYCKMDGGGNGCKKEGLYAVAYALDGDSPDGFYDRVRGYLEESNLVVCGDAYEERLLGDLFAADAGCGIARLEVEVRGAGA